MKNHPYRAFPASHFWKTAVSERAWSDIDFFPAPKFKILSGSKIATMGSCFAANIARHLKEKNIPIYDAEPHHPFISSPYTHSLGYSQFSARFGNIYTSRQLRELYEQALGIRDPIMDFAEEDGLYYDLLRPNVQNQGHHSLMEASADRTYHLNRVRVMFENASVIIFTLGLTEAWQNVTGNYCYPVCPGTAHGTFNPDIHQPVNYTYHEILSDLTDWLEQLQQINPEIKVILTVSPVQLVATFEADNVLVASSYSKSVLRAICGELVRAFSFVDYFPSFEIVSAPASRGMYLSQDLRGVTEEGISHVMRTFFNTYPLSDTPPETSAESPPIKVTTPGQPLHAAQLMLDALCDEIYNDPAGRA